MKQGSQFKKSRTRDNNIYAILVKPLIGSNPNRSKVVNEYPSS
jgi:stalled ribosome alternative rescue factor ArfA